MRARRAENAEGRDTAVPCPAPPWARRTWAQLYRALVRAQPGPRLRGTRPKLPFKSSRSVRGHGRFGVVVALRRLLGDARAAGALVVLHPQHLVQTLANPLDVGDEHHLLEAVLQVVQQLNHVVAPR